MADLDAELLALAGGDSSDEEEINTTSNAPKSASPPPSTGKTNTTAKHVSPTTTSMAKSGTKKASKQARKDDSEEEGEASSAAASPDSLQSAPMSESESDTSPNADVDDDGPMYPIENKFQSEKDKAEIMAMPEIQRESILAERAQIHERKQQDLHLRRLIQARESATTKPGDKKKRKAGAADLEEGQRKSSRQKTTLGGRKVGETSDAIEGYKRQREQKVLRDEQRRREGEERKERKGRDAVDDGYSDADAEGESEVEWDDKPRASDNKPRDELPADLHDFNRVRMGRSNFAEVCFFPGFDEAIKDCYARVSIGADRVTGESMYRMAHIKGFTDGKPYAMEGRNGKSFVTNRYAVVAIGKSTRNWPYLACSNAKFTETEFDRYKKQLIEEDIILPSKSFLGAKSIAIDNLIHRDWTEAELQEKLNKSGVLQNRFSSIERSAIVRRRKEAELRGDETAMAKHDAELAALDGPKLAFGTSLRKTPTKPAAATPQSHQSQQERLAALNRANRKANAEEVRKAQIAEKKAEAIARKAVERGEAAANPFARVKTRAKVHYDVNDDYLSVPSKTKREVDALFEGGSRDGSRAGTPLVGVNGKAEKKTETPERVVRLKQEERKGLPVLRQRNMDDDMIASMDLGIEIDL